MLKTLVWLPDNLSPFYKRTVKTGQADNTHHATPAPAPAPVADIITSSTMFCFSNCALLPVLYYKHPFGPLDSGQLLSVYLKELYLLVFLVDDK